MKNKFLAAFVVIICVLLAAGWRKPFGATTDVVTTLVPRGCVGKKVSEK